MIYYINIKEEDAKTYTLEEVNAIKDSFYKEYYDEHKEELKEKYKTWKSFRTAQIKLAWYDKRKIETPFKFIPQGQITSLYR